MGILIGWLILGVIGTASFYLTARMAILIGFQYHSQFLYSLVSLLVLLFPFFLQILDHLLANKFFSILATLGSRMLVFIVLFAVFLGIEHGIASLLANFGFKVTLFRIMFFWVVGPILLAIGLYNAFSTQTTEILINTPKVAKNLKILFVSDIHVNDIIAKRHLKTLSRKITQIQPDLILFGGDFFDNANIRHAEYYQILWDMDNFSTIGYAVAGNHDLMGERKALDRIQELLNIQWLSIDQVSSTIVHDFWIQLIAVPDKYQRKGKKIWELLLGTDIYTNHYSILLTHQPIVLPEIQNFPIDLTLAGHTHRGQVYGVRELVALINGYGYGLFEHGTQQAFVTQWLGTWGFPFRLGSRSEVVLFHLSPESAQ